MGQQDERGTRVDALVGQNLVRVVLQDAFPREAVLGGEGGARVDDDRVIACDARHREQGLGDMHRTHHHHPQRRVVDGDEGRAVLEKGRPIGAELFFMRFKAFQAALPSLGVDHMGHGAAFGAGLAQGGEVIFGKAVFQAHGLQKDADRPTTGKPHGKGVIVGDAIGQDTAAALFKYLKSLGNHRTLDTAARDGADQFPFSRDGEHGTNAARCGAPGFDHGRQRRALARAEPVERLFGYLIHETSPFPTAIVAENSTHPKWRKVDPAPRFSEGRYDVGIASVLRRCIFALDQDIINQFPA